MSREHHERHDCNICLKNCSKRQLASCLFCEYHICTGCARKWLLSLNEDPSCMNCHRSFNHDALTQLFGPDFVNNEWKKHRENVLLERETALLPETKPYVDQELNLRENRKRIRELEEEKCRLKRQVHAIDKEIHGISSATVALVESSESPVSVQWCAKDGCDGILDFHWSCRKCGGKTCRDCGTFKGEHSESHVCKEEDKASMRLIKNDSRRCVKCGVWTYKINGCDQMYCVAPGCNTAWDWKSGKRVTGVIHNPEYFRMRRELGRDLNDVPCGGTPTLPEVKRIWGENCEEYTKFYLLLRLLHHISNEELHRYPNMVIADDNRDLRVKFFLAEITTAQMKVKLQRREKKRNKCREIHMMLTMLVTTISDLLRQAVLQPTSFTAVYLNIVSLITIYNREMKKIASLYKCVVPCVYTDTTESGYWRIVTTSTPLTIIPRRPTQY